MIIKVGKCQMLHMSDSSKVNVEELKSNTFTLYILSFEKYNSSKDIYEFEIDKGKLYISSSNVAKVIIPKFSSLNAPIESLIASAIDWRKNRNPLSSIVKYIFVSY